MILYHGTNQSFDVVDLGKSKPNKDFGRGFYLSADYEQALAMAKIKVDTPKQCKYEIFLTTFYDELTQDIITKYMVEPN